MAVSLQNIENLVQKLGSSSPCTLKKALPIVARITKRSNEAEIFQKNGGLAGLLSLLKRPCDSIIDMSMSAIANCAMFTVCKKEIRLLDGILPIVSVLKNLKSTSILNRTARALANLAEDEENAMVIEELGAIEELAKCLDEPTDSDCQQSILRSIKIICSTQARKKIIVDHGCLKTIVELVKSDNQALQSCSIKTLCELTKNCPKELALHIQEFDGIKEIIKLANSEKYSVCSSAVMCLVNLCAHAHVRVSIGSEGGISILYHHAKSCNSSHLHLALRALEGLCYCCREAVNRSRVLECGGIELLLKHFSDQEHSPLQKKIITAFNCFYYNERCLEFLLSGGIVPALLSYLRIVIRTSHVVDHCGDQDDHFDRESFTSDFSSPTASPKVMPSVMEASNISLNETFLEEAANFAMQVRDAKESNRMLAFKRKRTKHTLTLSPSAKSIDQSWSLFSFSALGSTTETTSMIGTCTVSSRNTTPLVSPIHSHPRTLMCSTPLPQDHSLKLLTQNKIQNCIIGEKNLDDAELAVESPIDSVCSESNISKSGFVSAEQVPKAMESWTLNASRTDSECLQEKGTAISPSISSPKSCAPSLSHHAIHAPGHSALVLLSRFAQMTDQKGLYYLTTKSCMEVLLDYLSLVDNASPKGARLLNSLTLDPQCFESFVSMGLACDIHRQLCQGWTASYFVEVKISLQELAANEGSAGKDDNVVTNPKISLRVPENALQRSTVIGKKLLDNLACQTQTPFGKGVFIHLLSKGSSEELLGCVVTLPFTCRSKKLQNLMFIVKGGLRILCDALLDASNDKKFAMALYSLSFLMLETEVNGTLAASASEQSSPSKGHINSAPEEGREKHELCTESHFANERSIKRQKLCDDIETCSNLRPECFNLVDSSSNEGTCKYDSNDYGPYDIHLEIESGVRIAVHRAVLSNSSEVFAAMFSSNYKEGTLPVVQLKEISYTSLRMLIHKAYGCVFPCFPCSESRNVCSHVTEIVDSLTLDAQFYLLIDLLATSDRFLILDLKHFCENTLPLHANESNIVSLCFYAAYYQSDVLCEFGVKFLMLKVKDISSQYGLAKQVFTSQEKAKLVKSLYKFLLYHFQSEK